MRVLVGNKRPKVGHKMGDDHVEFEVLPPGEYVTEVLANDLLNVTAALTLHFVDGDRPHWVSCEDADMERTLCKYYGIEENKVPHEWLLRGGQVEN